MEEIDTVNLQANHVKRWRFRDRSGTIPAGPIVLRVTEDEKQWVHARLTLYAKQDGENFNRVRGRQCSSSSSFSVALLKRCLLL
ncbi:hypothetical protein Goshw_005132 [Gossypium schwendimanii]|uniref:Uncharacterized protein n=1 Tax=Gossypium schwendimanii TaxID=34291 RepID=A0A7J9N4L7_GOSSC|nr:hypothetical protein [Gossypium schwendimanii]